MGSKIDFTIPKMTGYDHRNSPEYREAEQKRDNEMRASMILGLPGSIDLIADYATTEIKDETIQQMLRDILNQDLVDMKAADSMERGRGMFEFEVISAQHVLKLAKEASEWDADRAAGIVGFQSFVEDISVTENGEFDVG